MLDFGGGTNTGTVVLVAPIPVQTGAVPNIDVLTGTLQLGGNFLNRIQGGTLTVATGAVFDLNGFGALVNVLSAPGHITNTGASSNLEVFDPIGTIGTIDGPIGLTVDGGNATIDAPNFAGSLSMFGGTLTLAGDAPNVTGTTLYVASPSATLDLGTGGTLAGNISDGGLVVLNRSNASTETGTISGACNIISKPARSPSTF